MLHCCVGWRAGFLNEWTEFMLRADHGVKCWGKTLNSFTPMGDQDRISPYKVNTISTR